MKILLYVPTLGAGGAEKVMVNLANYFCEENEVLLCSSFYSGKNGRYNNLINNKIHCVELGNHAIRTLRKTIRQHKPDYMMSTLHSAHIRLLLSKWLSGSKAKLIFREASIYTRINPKEDIKQFLLELINKRLYLFCDGIVANSPDTKKSLLKHVHINDNKIKVIGNPVLGHKEILHNSLLGESKEKFSILAVGRLYPVKRLDLLIDAISLIKDELSQNVVIVGDGILEDVLQEQINKNGLNDRVRLAGYHSELSKYYSEACCFVSCSDYEGFGNVLVEALSYGVPVVSTNCPGGPSYILNDGEFGILTECGDPISMGKAILTILKGEKVFKRNDLINRAEFFSVENQCLNYLNFFRSL